MRQVDARAVGKLLVLHEHEIPDLDEAVAVRVGTARRTARDRGPMVEENLRARPTRAHVAHRPEIVAAGDAQDFPIGNARDLVPQLRGFLVVSVDSDDEALRIEREVLGEQLPGEQDRALLEIVAEGEIAEHLEEGVVTRGVADIVEVVVLAARAHAFLRRRRAQGDRLLLTGEDVLERHHARIGEHQSRIVARHERARRDHRVIILGEEVEERRPDVVGASGTRANMRRAHRLIARARRLLAGGVLSFCSRRLDGGHGRLA